MPKWVKTIIALLLLPVCLGEGAALWRIMRASGGADTTWVPMLAGVGCWFAIYALLPRPMWVYVFGHELTHAVWTWLCGGKVTKFKASANGGHVVVSKSNFLIALAPYFFPFYAVLVVAVFLAGDRIWDWRAYSAWFHLLLGAAYAFHLTLTGHILKMQQTDITQQGYLFSLVIIFLGNATVLMLAIPLLAGQVDILTAFEWWYDSTRDVLRAAGRAF